MSVDQRALGRRTILAAAGLVTGLVALVGAGRAAATLPEIPDVGPASDAGDVIVIDASGRALSTGSSETPFTLVLPDDAECPGDSANDQWRWQTFIVPEGTDLGEIVYGGIGPEGPNEKSLYDTTSRYLSHQNLLPNQVAGQPGRIPTLPFMAFTGFPPEFFDDGAYRIGVACTFFRQTERYWDTGFVIQNTAVDGGIAQFRWTVPDAPDEGSVVVSGDESFEWRPVAGIAIAIASLAAAFFLWRSSRSTPVPEERS